MYRLLTKNKLTAAEPKFVIIYTDSPQGPTIVGTGTPEVSELPSARGYSWATLYPGVISTETWSSKLEVGRGANSPTP
jgi:hypothetical protein